MIKFAKAQAVGNDFLLIEVEDVEHLTSPDITAQRFCDRKLGPGADGVVFLSRNADQQGDFQSRIFNADGGEAEISGNGTRCLATYLYYKKLWTQPKIRIGTRVGLKTGKLVSENGLVFQFEFDMGTPILSSEEIPVALDPPREKVIALDLTVGDSVYTATCTSMGNPHCSIFLEDLDFIDLDHLGATIERLPIFPNRTNVEFVKSISPDEIEVRFWERGVGRTLSSGTGSCGASVASILNGVTGRKVKVHTLGGDLLVNWRDDGTVALTGEAKMIYEGQWLAD